MGTGGGASDGSEGRGEGWFGKGIIISLGIAPAKSS